MRAKESKNNELQNGKHKRNRNLFKLIVMNNEIKLLKAMLILANLLNVSNTFKSGLIEKITFMIDHLEMQIDNSKN